MNSKIIKIVFSTIFQDAGEATRAIEIAKGLKEFEPDKFKAQIIFISHGSRFEQKVLELGFDVYHAKPAMSGIGLFHDLKMKPGELIGEKKIAYDLLSGEIDAYKDINPDIVIYGFWPIGGIARRMLNNAIPGICFVPLPLTEAFIGEINDIPEQMHILSILPSKFRKFLIKKVPPTFKQRLPLLRHDNIRASALKLGWKGEPLTNIFCMLRADLIVVNDLHTYYDLDRYPDSIRFTGPLFSQSTNNDDIDEQIKEVFSKDNNRLKVFCTLGSSGTMKQLAEVIKVFTEGPGTEWNAVILSPPSVCPIDEAYKLAGERKGIFITDKFIPAKVVNSLADITICHGGQGTIQTAIASGTPVVAFAMQPEQQMNLDHIAAYGAAIRIPLKKWNSDLISKSICKIISDSSYKNNVHSLMNQINSLNGKVECSHAIWNKIEELIS